MAIKRFLSGHLLESEAPTGEIPNHLDKPVLMVYSGKFLSMDGKVEVDDEIIDRLMSTHNSAVERLKRMAGATEVPIRMYPPLQLDHSQSATMTVGRLLGPVTVGDYMTADGQKVKALMGKIRFLGKENVEKALDGRYGSVSIGADFETGKISELSVTPFPAAEEARMLSAGKTTEEENHMDLAHFKKSLKHHLEGLAHHMGHHLNDDEKKEHLAALAGLNEKLSVGPNDHMEGMDMKGHLEGVEKHAEGMKGKSMAKHHMEGLRHHLEGLKHHLESGPEEHKALAAHCENIMRHLEGMAVSDETTEEKAHQTHEAHMTALREGVKGLAAAQLKLITQNKRSQLAGRISRLRAAAKITPAEVKKIDLSRLSAESDATVDAVMKSYEDREPVILTGMVGNSKAETIAEIKKHNLSKLEHEMRLNMPSKKAEYEKKLAAAKASGSRLSEEPEVNVHIDALPGGEHDTQMAEIHKLMDEGKIPEAKEKLKHLFDGMKKHLGEHPAMEVEHKELSALADEVNKMQNQIDGLKKLAGI